MIKINTPNLDNIAEEYANILLSNWTVYKNSPISHKEIREMLTCPADKLVSKNNDLENQKSREDIKKTFNYQYRLIEKKYNIPNYKRQRQRLAYWLINKIGIQVCPYCNHNYILTRDSRTPTAREAQLDHFYSQDNYPALALSFYNLIPSCSSCNRIKGTKKLTHNPYISGFENLPLFKVNNLITVITRQEIPDITTTPSSTQNPLVKNDLDLLYINPLYAQQTSLAEDLIFKAQGYLGGYYDSVIETFFKDKSLSMPEIKRMLFGYHLEVEDLSKQPLSKFGRDILEQLGICTPSTD